MAYYIVQFLTSLSDIQGHSPIASTTTTTTATATTTTILCSLDFVWDYPGELVPER